jgi:hypothetical protein
MAHRKRRKRSAFVPRMIFATAFAGVVPLCVAGCGGGEMLGVAEQAFDLARPDAAKQPDFRTYGFFDVAAVDFAIPPDFSEGPDMSLAVADGGFRGDGGQGG